MLLATDADWIHEEIDAALAGDDIEVLRVRQGVDVLPTVTELEPDLVVLDLQIGNMGGMAACMDLRLDESVGKLPHTRCSCCSTAMSTRSWPTGPEADGWIVKPLDAFRLRTAATALLDGEPYQEGMATAEAGSRWLNFQMGGPSAHRLRWPPHITGVWLSLVERCVRDAEVVGSNPATPTKPKDR